MKTRIIDALVSISSGAESAIRKKLSEELPGTDLLKQAEKALRNILHDYSSFSVSTIDSFFQRILRSLAREIHLPLNLDVEIEMDDAILDTTDNLLKEIGIDPDLTEWMTKLALQKLDDEKGWNLEGDIGTVARELFRERQNDIKPLTREEIHFHYQRLVSIRQKFERTMADFGKEALEKIKLHHLDIADFAHGKTGPASYFNKIVNGRDQDSYVIKGRVMDAMSSPDKWSKKTSEKRNEIIDLVTNHLIPILHKIESYLESELKTYFTAVEILKKLYLFGIVNDLRKKFTQYRTENNVILISDTTRLLNEVIHDSDAPFLYEKTGNRYKHLLIDEFQDTSLLQWKNLLPLIVNALGSGFTTLIVGDAKQSIYRWRGGNMNLLLKGVFQDLKNFETMMKEEVLSMNFRSRKAVIDFNNDFFATATKLADEQMQMKGFSSLHLAYNKEIRQEIAEKNSSGGYVKINFIDDQSKDDEVIKWKATALEQLLQTIRDLQSKDYNYKDICILVRRNEEGNDIANWLFGKGIHDIISPDSLLISSSPKIQFILNTLKFLIDNLDTIAKSEILYYYRRYIAEAADADWHEIFADHKNAFQRNKSKSPKSENVLFEGLEKNIFNKMLPPEFTSDLNRLAKLPAYEVTEQIISIFKLNKVPDAYIQRFQDLVLDYTARSNGSIEEFLHWWENSNSVRKASVVIPENTDAIKIMTIHRAKGLQFPVVIIPFADWRLLPKTGELLWMATENTPFSELGTVVVSSSAQLKETFFSEEYETEINQTIIDNLNLLYVAFTRAEEKLFVFCPSDNETDLKTASKLIYRTCKLLNSEFTTSYESGEFEASNTSKKESAEGIKNELLASYPSNIWQNKLSLKMQSGDLLSIFDDNKLSKVNYGILVHEVLATIKNRNDVDAVTDKIIFGGLISEDEKSELRKQISEVLSVPEIGAYFNTDISSFAEREIILPNGEKLRPDRVIFYESGIKVIDFKTGRRDVRHADQVLRYARTLRSMGYENVVCEVVYLAEKKIVRIEENMQSEILNK